MNEVINSYNNIDSLDLQLFQKVTFEVAGVYVYNGFYYFSDEYLKKVMPNLLCVKQYVRDLKVKSILHECT